MLDNLSTGSIDNIAHLKGRAGFEYFIDTVDNEPLLAELIDRSDVVFHLAAAVGVKLIVEQPVLHHRNQRARHRSGAEARQQEEEARGDRLDLGGLRQERGRAVPRGFGSGPGPDAEAPLGVRVQQGDRRVPGAGLLEGAQAAGDHRPLLQHRRPPADGAVRDGDSEFRPPGARRRTDHGVRRRHAVARVHARRRRRRRAAEAGGGTEGDRPGHQHRQHAGGHHSRARRARARSDRLQLGDQADPVRRGLRVRVRGHAAPGARPDEGRGLIGYKPRQHSTTS